MHSVLVVLGVIACPLGMFAMGGVAWAARKLGIGRSPTQVDQKAPRSSEPGLT